MNWECIYCGRKQIASDANRTMKTVDLQVGKSADGRMGLAYLALRCLNEECNRLTLSVQSGSLETAPNSPYARLDLPPQYIWQLLPASSAKPQPDYIPLAVREDYYEACKIKNDSPKASATLSRRCLQGMIRDFCKISKNRLIDEIAELEKQLVEGSAPRGVDDETIAAITAVRKLGNIGAHMEKDINIIVDVDPNEAQTLIELIEMLFADWYVARHKRQHRLASIEEITAAKEVQKKPSGPAPAPTKGGTA